MLSHQSHLWVVEQRLAGADMRQERALIAAPLYHMNGLALAQLASAAHITVVLLPQFEARAYIRAIGAHRVTWITGVPPMMAMLLQERELLAATDTSCVRQSAAARRRPRAALLAAIRAAFPAAQFVNGYGTTEAGPVVFGPHPDGLPTPPLSVGYPHPAEAAVARGGRNPAQGVLEQRCPAQMNGYWNRPDLKPPLTADGFYITGDVFHRDGDGFFTWSAGSTTCSSRVARTFSRARSRRCWSVIRRWSSLPYPSGGRHQGHEARGLRSARRGRGRSTRRR